MSILFFFFIKLVISYVVLSGFSKALVNVEFENSDSLAIYYSSGKGFQEKLSAASPIIPAGVRQDAIISLKDNVVRKFRIDPGHGNGTVKLYQVTLKSFYGNPVTFNHHQIFDLFEPDNIASFTLEDDHVRIVSASDDPSLIYKDSLKLSNIGLSTIIPAAFSIAFFALLSNVSLPSFPAFNDLAMKTSSTGLSIGSLDGIRGFAALTVLAEHTGILKGLGSLGVWLFFALSGFLLATPFVQKPERAVSYDYMSYFLSRRMKRILPMYYSFLTVSMVFSGKNPELFRHFLFLQGNGHLWTIPQEMFFYLLLPFLVMAIYLLLKSGRMIIILFLLVLIIGMHRYMTVHIVSFYGYGTSKQSMAGIFIGGVLFSYMYHWLNEDQLFQRFDRDRVRRNCSVVGLLLFIVLTIFSLKMVPGMEQFNPFNNPGIFGFFAGVLILLVVLADRTFLSRIFGFLPFRAIGLVSFSFYLLHPHMISFSRAVTQYYLNFRLGGLAMFIISGCLTYLCAVFTYTYIERPFLYGSTNQGQVAGTGLGVAEPAGCR